MSFIYRRIGCVSTRLISYPKTSFSYQPKRFLCEKASEVVIEADSHKTAASLIPRQIVKELDRHIVGQYEAKRAVAIALRNRWRRHKLPHPLSDEVHPKNILMIGPTGVGKTEVVRRVSKLIDAPFIKVEATKFTEVGFHGRDVDTIIRDLLDFAIIQTKEKIARRSKDRVKERVEQRIVELLIGKGSDQAIASFLKLLREGALEERTIEVQIADQKRIPMATVIAPGSSNNNLSGGSLDLTDLFSSLGMKQGSEKKTKVMKIKDARPILEEQEIEKETSHESVVQEAILAVEQDGIVCIDEIDKICSTARSYGSGASDEGVQKDLLPLIEGCVISTKYGNVKTDHILFIASGAFLTCKPSDLLAELQGRLPIRVELQPLSVNDLYQILTEPEHNLIVQQKALLHTENIDVIFEDEALREISRVAYEVNQEVENIGARRLSTIIEKVVEELSFNAPELKPESVDQEKVQIVINKAYVLEKVGPMLKKSDLRKFIL